MNGLELQAQLAEMGIRLPTVMMSGHGDISMAVRAMTAGAVDFLSKPFRGQDMLDAVTSGIALDRSRLMADFDIFRMWQRYDSLSRREQQVMMLVTAGKMNKHVAGDLGISEITVKIYRRHAKDGCSHLRRSCQNGRNDQAQG